ncbi:MAG: DNA-binding protein YbiB [Acidithiobacillus sp.]
MRTLPQLIGDVARGKEHARDLPEEEAQALFAAWLAGDLDAYSQGALWTAYRIKGESADELLGFVTASEQAMHRINAPAGPLPVILPSYNGARREANLLPLLALVLARAGVPVLLHGSHGGAAEDADLALTDHSPANRVSTAALLTTLGLPPAHSPQAIRDDLQKQNLAHAPIDALSPGLARILALRQQLGVRSSVHTVVKLINPFAGPAIHCAAVTHPPYLERLKTFFGRTRRRALCLRGTEGEPFAHPKRRPALLACQNGVCTTLLEKDGQPLLRLPDLPADGGITATCRFIEEVLNGTLALPDPLFDQAACLLVLSGRSPGLDAAGAVLAAILSAQPPHAASPKPLPPSPGAPS